MRLNEVEFNDALPIDGYGAGFFRVGGQIHKGAVLVSPKGCTSWGGYEDHDPLLALAGQVDVLFIGTGAETAHIPKGLRATLDNAGIGAEAMNSPAAARTYNVLLSEGRRVAIALLAVE